MRVHCQSVQFSFARNFPHSPGHIVSSVQFLTGIHCAHSKDTLSFQSAETDPACGEATLSDKLGGKPRKHCQQHLVALFHVVLSFPTSRGKAPESSGALCPTHRARCQFSQFSPVSIDRNLSPRGKGTLSVQSLTGTYPLVARARCRLNVNIVDACIKGALVNDCVVLKR